MVSTFRRVNLHIAHSIIERQRCMSQHALLEIDRLVLIRLLSLFVVFMLGAMFVFRSFVRWCLFLVGYINNNSTGMG